MDKINNYVKMLIKVNKIMNLTGANGYNEIILRHVNDSLAILDFIQITNDMKVLDMGTGAGFPGIPLAIKTKASFTLTDSLKKRIAFLDNVCRQLEIKNVELSDMRAEEFLRQKEYREKYDIALSRAVAPLNLLLEYTIPSLKIGGRFYAYKSCNIDDEIIKSKNALEVLNCQISNIFEYKLKDSKNETIELKILEITKHDKTDDKYPRRVGIPAKRPL